ncbi:MAG: L-seryl-tRNA(Sec) selenium transferase [Chloroflexi bacterium]|nr:L-seryl-tRNA(Sec) selenium transferase [Chloroflexota bacterium]
MSVSRKITEAREGVDALAEYRKLPAIDTLLHEPAIALLSAQYGAAQTTESLRTLLAQARQAIATGQPAPLRPQWAGLLMEALAQANLPSLRALINATGVIIHTNLGRAPLSQAASAAVAMIAGSYSNLEYDLTAGIRGSRHQHTSSLLRELTNAEDALAVNNNAAALYLVLATLCAGREVLISRGQLVEIGGGFRIPDVLRQSGARLVEVGATNRTHPRDFSEAITPNTAAIMRVHSSNFRQIGFVAMPELSELAKIVQTTNAQNGTAVQLIDDLGSGTLLDTSLYQLAPEPMVQQSVTAGADIITFSGDKLLGGPQAGLILGRRRLIEQVRQHPMARALRVDKMTLAALDTTLRSYQRGTATQEIPVWQMISATPDALEARIQGWITTLHTFGIEGQVWPGESAIGGGSLPGETLPTRLLAIASAQPNIDAARLRAQAQPVVCRIQQNHLIFDARTVLAGEDGALLDAIKAIFS